MFNVRMNFYRASDHNHKLAAWPKYANMSLPTLEKYAPTTLEEMKGVATGAELPLTTLLQLATDYENGLWLKGVTGQPVGATMPTKACTAFGFTDSASGRTFCGQNNDEKHTEFLNGTLDAVIARPAIASSHGPAVATITYSHPGMPAYMGTNGAGLSVLWTAIAFNDVPARPTETVPTVVLIREVLQFTTLDGAVAYLRETPRSVPNNFILVRFQRAQHTTCARRAVASSLTYWLCCQSQPGVGVVSIEMSATHFTALHVTTGEVAHSNTENLDQIMEDADPIRYSGADNRSAHS
jgi:hypothetical protein